MTLLVEKGADASKTGRDQRTPCQIALAAGHVEVVEFLQKAEDEADGEEPSRRVQEHCKAYLLGELRKFSAWAESIRKGRASRDGFADDDECDGLTLADDNVVFIHQDHTVTRSMWHNEDVIFNQVSPEWKEFCTTVLKFEVLSPLDLIAPVKSTGSDRAQDPRS